MINPILITGCGRSGASMIAGALNMCGAFCGNVGGHNKHYENVQIRHQLMSPLLVRLGADPRGQYPIPNLEGLPVITNWADRVESIMVSEGYYDGCWLVKSPTLSLVWPVWAEAFPKAKWLIVRRRTADILHSCIKTHFMTAFRDIKTCRAVGARNEMEGWLWWIHQYEKRFVEMIKHGIEYCEIWPERMVSGDYSQMISTAQWLGLDWRKQAFAFIDPKLMKARQSIRPVPIARSVGESAKQIV